MLEEAVTGVGRRIVAALSIVIWQSEVEARGSIVTTTSTVQICQNEDFMCQSSRVGLQVINASLDRGEHRAGEGVWPVRLSTDFFDDSMGGEMLQNTPCTVGQKTKSKGGKRRSTR